MSNIKTAGPNVSQAFSGTVKSAGQLLGTNTNDDALDPNVGRYLESKNSSSTNVGGSSGVYWDAASLTLTAGDWDVQGHVIYFRNSATFSSVATDIGIGGTSGSTFTGQANGVTEFFSTAAISVTFTNASILTPSVRVQSDGTNLYINGTTYSSVQIVYLKANLSSYSVATPQYVYLFRARRTR